MASQRRTRSQGCQTHDQSIGAIGRMGTSVGCRGDSLVGWRHTLRELQESGPRMGTTKRLSFGVDQRCLQSKGRHDSKTKNRSGSRRPRHEQDTGSVSSGGSTTSATDRHATTGTRTSSTSSTTAAAAQRDASTSSQQCAVVGLGPS